MPETPLPSKTITEVAGLIQSRQISPVELVEALLSRIEELDGRLKSYAVVTADRALASAETAEKEIVAGNYRGPLHGVPIAVKDLCFTKGVRTMGGTGVLADHVPAFDATVVTRLEAAGAVLLGKLNLTEGAMNYYHPDFEIPVNPWDPDRDTGSSSSGSGVATAAGLCCGSLGSDTGGSIRFPAAACGIVGLKPTYGRVSRYGVLALAESLDHVGPMTRSTADAAIMLQAIAGYDPNDPTSLPDPVPDMMGGIGQSIQGIRLGLDEQYVTKDVDPQLAHAVLDAVRILEGRGARIVEVKMPDMDEYVEAWNVLCSAEAVVAHEETYPSRRGEYGPWFREWLDQGAAVTGAAYAKANNLRAACNGFVLRVFKEIDVLACPSMPGAPGLIDREQLYGPMEEEHDTTWGRFTVPSDLNGAPTLSVPCSLNSEGLPLSLQFVGKHLAERLLCRVGHAYEEVTEWHNLRPPV